MDGIINCFKPLGLTSARCLDRVRRITGQRKSGHAGTLDPAADGVLVLCMGKATKLVEQMMDLPKAYVATARLDVTSASYDSERELLPVQVSRMPSGDEVHAACARQVGTILQMPPAVSALKIGGRPAYSLERAGKAVELAPRSIRIYALELEKYEWPLLTFSVRCGRGTYVRALIRDIGADLQVGGCLTALRRTAVGPFNVEQAWTLERLEPARPGDYLLPLDRARELLEQAHSADSPG